MSRCVPLPRDFNPRSRGVISWGLTMIGQVGARTVSVVSNDRLSSRSNNEIVARVIGMRESELEAARSCKGVAERGLASLRNVWGSTPSLKSFSSLVFQRAGTYSRGEISFRGDVTDDVTDFDDLVSTI